VAAIFARGRLMQVSGVERSRLARDSYAYLHLPMVAGIVLLAFGVETMLHDVAETLAIVPAMGLCGGIALYLLGHIAFLFRATHYVFRRRTLGAGVLLALIPAAIAIPALATLALVSAVCSVVVAYEAIRYRADRARVRHPEGP
jgi:low temperature requirement protein LtrA